MLCIPALDTVRNIARFVTEAGYTEARMRQLGFTKVPWRKSPARSLLPYKIPEDAPLNLLVRLFWFGESASFEELSSTFPPEIIEALMHCRLLERELDRCVPQCMLVRFGELLLACDSVRSAQGPAAANLVLGTNPPTKILANSLISRPDTEVLDLGTGCGTLALIASRFARCVMATDLNHRALTFAEFNATLNGITNIQRRAGDRFAPIEGQKFDLIACNPPFFLKPASRLLFTDNPAELDSFVEGLARSAPQFLNEGGFFQMLCEWVALPDEGWQSRLNRWFENSSCDVLILKAYEMSTEDYVLTRTTESASLYGEAHEDQLFEHIRYFQQHRVERIFGGLVTMRRRAAENWFSCEEMDEIPDEGLGELLLERFATQDILSSCKDLELLTAKPRIAKGARLITESIQRGRSWDAAKIYLERRTGLPRRLAFDRVVANFVGRFDGKQSLDLLTDELAAQNKVPRGEAKKNGLQLVRKLASLGLVALEH